MEWMKGTQVKISFKRRGWVHNVFQNGSRSKLSLSKSQHRTWKLPAMHTFRYVRMIAHYLPSTSRDRSISCPHARTNQNMPPILLTMFKLFLPVFDSSFPLSNSLFSRPFASISNIQIILKGLLGQLSYWLEMNSQGVIFPTIPHFARTPLGKSLPDSSQSLGTRRTAHRQRGIAPGPYGFWIESRMIGMWRLTVLISSLILFLFPREQSTILCWTRKRSIFYKK